MRLPSALLNLGLTAQIPFLSSYPSATPKKADMAPPARDFAFKEGSDVFSPKDLIQLARPGQGVANDAGDLVLVPYSQFSLADKKNKKSLAIVPVQTKKHIEIPLEKGGEAFWLNSRSLAHVVESEDDKGGLEIYVINIQFNSHSSEASSEVSITTTSPTLIGKLPNKSATNFKYSSTTGYLVFSDYVYSNGNISDVARLDEEWENRGNSAFVYDETFERHWDTWVGEKKNVLFSTRLYLDPDHKWRYGEEFKHLFEGTKHSAPVEPFGGTDDFDVSGKTIIYTTKDPELPEAWHTKQNVYITDVEGKQKPKELTSGKHAATHSPVLDPQGRKAAWLELDKDGYESDRAKIVIYDLEKDVRYTLTQEWDRSPDALAFSKDGRLIYFTAGDEAKVKIYALPIPPTPSSSTTHPKLDKIFTNPIPLTHDKAASGIQPLFTGRLLFTQSSLTSPNEVFIIHNLPQLEEAIVQGADLSGVQPEIEQLTSLTKKGLEGKKLSEGESYWFEGANGKNVQGWILKPKGYKEGEEKKWPVVLLIHGGPQGAWEDQWSNRWNPNIFAQQGYFVVMINPTGSTTFGQEFTDAIAEDWGGKPFVDMQKGWKTALEKYPAIDADRAVAAGASWGGYAIYWIQGHPEFGFNFKALVAHDGVFDSNYNGYSTDELFFFNHEWGGRPWDAKSKALSEKFSPSNFVHKWSTPLLAIHGSKDYRLPETESIAAFHALQQLGIRSRLLIFPDENHWVLKHGNSLKWHYEVFRWFDEFVGEQ